MKQLVYGGILMITGMLGVIVSADAGAFRVDCRHTRPSIPFLIAFAGIILFAVMAFLGYYEHGSSGDEG